MIRSTAASVSGISSGSQSTVCDGPSRGQAEAPCRAGITAMHPLGLFQRESHVGRRKAQPQHAQPAHTAGKAQNLLAQQGTGNLSQGRLVEADQPLDMRGHGVVRKPSLVSVMLRCRLSSSQAAALPGDSPTCPCLIDIFLCRTDNFGYLVHDVASGRTAAIDAPDAKAIKEALQRRGWKLTDLFITHHHTDHVEGIPVLKREYGVRVVGPQGRSRRRSSGSRCWCRPRIRCRSAKPTSSSSKLRATRSVTSSITIRQAATCSPPMRCFRSVSAACSRASPARCGKASRNCGPFPMTRWSIPATSTPRRTLPSQ